MKPNIDKQLVGYQKMKTESCKTSTKISLKAKGGLDKLYVKLNQGTYVKLTRIVTSNAFFLLAFRIVHISIQGEDYIRIRA